MPHVVGWSQSAILHHFQMGGEGGRDWLVTLAEVLYLILRRSVNFNFTTEDDLEILASLLDNDSDFMVDDMEELGLEQDASLEGSSGIPSVADSPGNDCRGESSCTQQDTSVENDTESSQDESFDEMKGKYCEPALRLQ